MTNNSKIKIPQEQEQELVDRLEKGWPILNAMEEELCGANGGVLPGEGELVKGKEKLTKNYNRFFGEYAALLEEYEKLTTEQAHVTDITKVHFHAVSELRKAVYAWVTVDKYDCIVDRGVTVGHYEINGHTANYNALVMAGRMAQEKGLGEEVIFYGCNQVVIGQCAGTMAVSAAALIPLLALAKATIPRLEGRVRHNLKEENLAATFAWNTFRQKHPPVASKTQTTKKATVAEQYNNDNDNQQQELKLGA